MWIFKSFLKIGLIHYIFISRFTRQETLIGRRSLPDHWTIATSCWTHSDTFRGLHATAVSSNTGLCRVHCRRDRCDAPTAMTAYILLVWLLYQVRMVVIMVMLMAMLLMHIIRGGKGRGCRVLLCVWLSRWRLRLLLSRLIQIIPHNEWWLNWMLLRLLLLLHVMIVLLLVL